MENHQFGNAERSKIQRHVVPHPPPDHELQRNWLRESCAAPPHNAASFHSLRGLVTLRSVHSVAETLVRMREAYLENKNGIGARSTVITQRRVEAQLTSVKSGNTV